MRLEQAIKQLRKESTGGKRRDQMISWLEELQKSRKVIRELREVIKQHEILTEPIWNTLAEMGVITTTEEYGPPETLDEVIEQMENDVAENMEADVETLKEYVERLKRALAVERGTRREKQNELG